MQLLSSLKVFLCARHDRILFETRRLFRGGAFGNIYDARLGYEVYISFVYISRSGGECFVKENF